MAQAPRPLQIPYTSEEFPWGLVRYFPYELSVTWEDIIWAAVTIGRPSVHHTFQYGASSWYEAMFRIAIVRTALEQYGLRARRLRRTEAYKNLDPTEKGAISYFLGMAFCKLFSSKNLNTPWLLHLDVYKNYRPTVVHGRSRPDLFGQQSGSGRWLAFETKGRASKPSSRDKIKAKLQAQRIISVSGSPCLMNIGTFTFFTNDVLNFLWIDPLAESAAPIDLPEVGDAWRHYFGPIRSLWLDKPRGGPNKADDLVVRLPEIDVEIHINHLLAQSLYDQKWEMAQRKMFESAAILIEEGFYPDGLKVVCGPTWTQRISDYYSDFG